MMIAMLLLTSTLQSPPPARRVEVVDTLHGVRVPDPYRWLEDMGSPETMAWAKAQDDATLRFVRASPSLGRFRERVAMGANAPRYGTPTERHGVYFMTSRSTGGGGALVMRRGVEGKDEVVIDARDLAPAALASVAVDPIGSRVAYVATEAGSQWGKIRVRDVRTKRDLPDVIDGFNTGSSGFSWVRDGSGFYYERYDLPTEDLRRATRRRARIMYHRLGDPESRDRVVLAAPRDDRWTLGHAVSSDGRYLIVTSNADEEPGNRVLVADLARNDTSFITMIGDAAHSYRFAGTLGTRIYFDTDDGAGNGRVIAIDAGRPTREHWQEVVPESNDAINTWGGTSSILIGETLLVMYRRDARSVVKLFHADGSIPREIALPAGGAIWSPFVPATDNQRALYNVSGVVDPGTGFELDLATGTSMPLPAAALGYDPQDYITQQVFYRGKDGTRIPMFLVHRKDVQPDGSAPVWMYGYGYARWSAAPWFQPLMVGFLAEGGVFALPNTRGGGEYGEAWHLAGVHRNRQTAIDDYIAAAEWLIAQRWTSRDRMIANGSSAGGPVAAAALLQRPDLFAAGVLDYPALDMLRYDRFTGASTWVPTLGTIKDPDDFRALYSYSPYHNVKSGCYPPILVAPGERDEITPPLHAYKFVAALQNAQTCGNPVLMRIAWGAGHFAGANTASAIEMWADQLAFLDRVLPARVR